MTISLSSSISGIQSSMKGHAISAHDIANSNTPGFEEQRIHFSERKPDGVSVSHISRTPNKFKDISGTDLAEEMKEQKIQSSSVKMNSSVIKVQNEMTGTLIDIIA